MSTFSSFLIGSGYNDMPAGWLMRSLTIKFSVAPILGFAYNSDTDIIGN